MIDFNSANKMMLLWEKIEDYVLKMFPQEFECEGFSLERSGGQLRLHYLNKTMSELSLQVKIHATHNLHKLKKQLGVWIRQKNSEINVAIQLQEEFLKDG